MDMTVFTMTLFIGLSFYGYANYKVARGRALEYVTRMERRV